MSLLGVSLSYTLVLVLIVVGTRSSKFALSSFLMQSSFSALIAPFFLIITYCIVSAAFCREA